MSCAVSRTHVMRNIETCETDVASEEGGLHTVCVLMCDVRPLMDTKHEYVLAVCVCVCSGGVSF